MKTISKRAVLWISVFALVITMVAACGLTLPFVSAADAVYYSENFNSYTNGTLPSNWTIDSDSGITDIKVQDGGLVINGLGTDAQTRVFYTGGELANKGDYVFEADYTILQSDQALSASTRFTGMIFRANVNDIYPYYYFTTRVRSNTTLNEFSVRSTKNQFIKIDQAAQPNNQALNTTYHLKVICSGVYAKFYIDDTLVFNSKLDTTGATYPYFTAGSIGFTTSNLKIKIDNITVKEFSGSIVSQPAMCNTYIPDTNIVNPPSVITHVTSDAVYASMSGTKLPSTAIYHLNSALNITTPDGSATITALTNALNMMAGKIVPAFYVKDYATVDALTAFATEAGLKDAFLVAEDAALLKYARDKNVNMYGVLYTKLSSAATEDDLAAMYANTNKAWAKTVMVDAEYMTKDDVEYLQKRLMNVWVTGHNGTLTSEEKFDCIYKGVNGIVDTDHANTLWIYESGVFNASDDPTPIVIRSPFLYAHRGYSSYANQNTMEAFYGAVLYGADLIEMDVRLTSDGVVVIYHDDYLHTLTTCTDTTKKVENTTYAELMTYEVDDLAAYGYPNGKIATLREFLELIEQTDDVVGIIEIKNYDYNLVDKSAAIVKEMGMEDQVVSICFGQAYCERMRSQLPGVSVGWLANAVADYKTPADIINFAKGYIMRGNLTYHPNYGQIQTSAANSMIAGVTAFGGQRGLNFNPWTYNSQVAFDTAYVGGIQGITTDYLEFDNNYIRRLDSGYAYQLKEGVATAVQGLGYNSQNKKLVNAIFKRTGGAKVDFTNANGKVTASGTGHATGVLMYKSTTANCGSFYTISGLTSVFVTAEGGTTPTTSYRESLLPPYVEKWQNTISNQSIAVTRDERGEVLTNTSGSWPAVTYTMTDKGDNNAVNGITASLEDSVAIDAIVGDKICIVMYLSDGSSYMLQKHISGEFAGDDLICNGARIRATIPLADVIPASVASGGNVTITGICVFNVSAPGTEIVIKSLDLVREVPALYGLIGDVNSSGDVSTADARVIVGLTIGRGSVNAEEAKRADFNEDGKVDSLDARVLLRTFVK